MRNKLLSSLCILTLIPLSLFSARTEKVLADEENIEEVEEADIEAVESDSEIELNYSDSDFINHPTFDDEQEQIRNEIFYGDLELLAQLIHAEAGNQDLDGKRLVADVVLNRVDAGFENNIEAVIYQSGQFSCIDDGNFDKAAYEVTQEDFDVAYMEMTGERLDTELVWYRTEHYSSYGTPAYKHGDHYFSKR